MYHDEIKLLLQQIQQATVFIFLEQNVNFVNYGKTRMT